MLERGRYSTTTPARPRRPCRPRHPYAVPRTSLQCVCTRRRNCIEQLSPSPEYAPGTVPFPARNSATIKLTHYRWAPFSAHVATISDDELATPAATKKPRAMPGAFCLDRAPKRTKSVLSSVLRDDRAAELVVQAGGDQIDVLTDAIVADQQASAIGEGVGLVLHEQMVVFETDRPIRSEGILGADADRATPAGVIAGGTNERARGVIDAVRVRGHSRTALDVQQEGVGGIADLTGEQAERVGLRVVHETGAEEPAGVAALEVSPVALPFHAEHPGAGLPAIADLATDGATSCIVGTLGAHHERQNRIPVVAARTPTTVGADVETAPVVHSGDHRGRLGVRTRSGIPSGCGRSRAQRAQAGRNKQNLLHSFDPISVCTAPKAVRSLIAFSD